MFFVVVTVIIVVVVIALSMYVVPDNMVYVIERKGSYHSIATPGRHFYIPYIDTIANKIFTAEQTVEIPAQEMITWDNQINLIRFYITYKVTAPQSYTYGVENAPKAIEYLVITTMRNVFGDIRKPEITSKHTELRSKILSIITEASKTWGVEILDMDYQMLN